MQSLPRPPAPLLWLHPAPPQCGHIPTASNILHYIRTTIVHFFRRGLKACPGRRMVGSVELRVVSCKSYPSPQQAAALSQGRLSGDSRGPSGRIPLRTKIFETNLLYFLFCFFVPFHTLHIRTARSRSPQCCSSSIDTSANLIGYSHWQYIATE
jgi:hypothetical protein